MLLQAGTLIDAAELLSEADVFAAVWNGLIRNREERAADGTLADDREAAALAAARRALQLPAAAGAPAAAAAALRSAGVLRTPANPALSAGDEFATDLLRDFALCRLFLIDGWDPLAVAGLPRWAIRAVLLACQARLLPHTRASAWRELRETFDRFARADGDRWSEMPFEALLTLGGAEQAIAETWDQLLADDAAGLRTLLRLAQLRHVTAGFGHPYVLAPIVANAFLADADLGQRDRYPRHGSIGETVRELVLAWLRGMARDDAGPDPLRQQVRDRILSDDPPVHDKFVIEAFSTLGPDLDTAAEAWLRRLADNAPNRLHEAVESTGAAIAMSQARPTLLLDLAEAYYIEKPDPHDRPRASARLRDHGIRDFQHGIGIGAPAAAWYFGPFYRLLNTAPRAAVTMINKMLDHAAAVHVDHRNRRAGGRDPDDAIDGYTFDLPSIGERRYRGDAAVWCWYRGSTAGPYPCMSALLAVEKFADHLLGPCDIPMRAVVDLLLRDCHNLAMAGLVVGLLTRHPDQAGDLLDPWLAHPAVWDLKVTRVVHEHWHVQGPDDADIPGRERRLWTSRESAAEMTLRAAAAGDQARLDALAAVGDRLRANARAQDAELIALTGGDTADQRPAFAEVWASALDPGAYRLEDGGDGLIVAQYQPPSQIAAALTPTADDLRRGNEALRLQLAYGDHIVDEHQGTTDALIDDIALARQLQVDPPASGLQHLEDPVTAVAAAAITAHATAAAAVSEDDLVWAAETALAAAVNPRIDFMSIPQSTYPMGADRAAAKAVPLLLLEPFDRFDLDRPGVNEALTALATSLYDEVRIAFAPGCAAVFAAPCAPDPAGVCRRHPPAWAAAQAGLADCRLGPWDFQTQKRLSDRVPPPYEETIPAIAADQLLVNRITMPLLAAAAARAAACVRDHAARLLPVLLNAHRRGLDHRSREGYDDHIADVQGESVAGLLVRFAVDGDTDQLVAHLRTFAGNANALQQLLHDLAAVFTYDERLRPSLPAVWTLVLQTILDAVDAGAGLLDDHWVNWAIGAMLPTPQPRAADPAPDATLAHAAATWISPQALDPLIDRWISIAAGEPKAADAVAQLARTAPIVWQTSTGLEWLDRVIGGRYDRVANHCWHVPGWLTDIREAARLDREALARWRRLVDGLASAGDRRAVDLQRLDE